MVLKYRIFFAMLLVCASLPGLAVPIAFQEPGAPPAADSGSAISTAGQADAAAQNGQSAAATQNAAQDRDLGNIEGTVTDQSGDLIPGATVTLEGMGTRSSTVADGNGAFTFKDVKPGAGYQVKVSAKDFDDWASPPIELTAGAFVYVKDIRLKLPDAVTSVTVSSDTTQIAVEQVTIEEKQRVFGIIPNFYVVYDSDNAVPMTAKLKFKLAFRVSVDPIAFAGAAFLGAVNQAADTPDYHQGWLGYGKRVGAVYADGFSDILFGGAILPVVLRQDPRYFYQGTGTVRSRMLHAMEAPFVCKGDNGKWQPNYSSVGGDLISSSLSDLYYPKSNRGVNLVFENLLISSAERVASTLIQEFVLRKFTPSAHSKH